MLLADLRWWTFTEYDDLSTHVEYPQDRCACDPAKRGAVAGEYEAAVDILIAAERRQQKKSGPSLRVLRANRDC